GARVTIEGKPDRAGRILWCSKGSVWYPVWVRFRDHPRRAVGLANDHQISIGKGRHAARVVAPELGVVQMKRFVSRARSAKACVKSTVRRELRNAGMGGKVSASGNDDAVVRQDRDRRRTLITSGIVEIDVRVRSSISKARVV